MPYHRVDPVDESLLRVKRYIGHHTICEKWREVWRQARQLEEIGAKLNNEEIKKIALDLRFKCREGMAMGKHMHESMKKRAFLEYTNSETNEEK